MDTGPHSRDRIDEVSCSDGAAVTEAMWCANQMADLLAKQAAESVQHLPATRSWLQSREKQLKQLAIFVGKLNCEANAHKLPDGSVVRDSEPMPARAKSSRQRPKQPDPQLQTVCQGRQHADLPARAAVASAATWSLGARARVSSAPPAAAVVRARQRNAHSMTAHRDEEAFQSWWRDNRSQRLRPDTVRASGQDRLAQVRARLLSRSSQ